MADAWDDDWIQKADTEASASDKPMVAAKLTKAERRAKQLEFNKEIWQAAEKPEDNYFLKTQGIVPLKSEFKPTMKVLSRKPATKTITTVDGVQQITLEDDDEDDEAKIVLTPEQRIQKTQREREEKQKAYEERRREIFGNDSNPSTAASGKKSGSPRNQSKAAHANDSRPSSAASNKNRLLFDPHESAKPDALRPQKGDAPSVGNQPVREPKAPDGSGRGGFGFAPRGGKAA